MNCIAFYQVLFLRAAGVSGCFKSVVYCVFSVLKEKTKIQFPLVFWGGRTVSLHLLCCYSWKGTEHLCNLEVQIPNNSEMIVSAFTLQKENLETLEAIGFLAAELGVLPSDFSYTGIKDKKAVTFQPMVVRKVTPERYVQYGCIQFSTYFYTLISINQCGVNF